MEKDSINTVEDPSTRPESNKGNLSRTIGKTIVVGTIATISAIASAVTAMVFLGRKRDENDIPTSQLAAKGLANEVAQNVSNSTAEAGVAVAARLFKSQGPGGSYGTPTPQNITVNTTEPATLQPQVQDTPAPLTPVPQVLVTNAPVHDTNAPLTPMPQVLETNAPVHDTNAPLTPMPQVFDTNQPQTPAPLTSQPSNTTAPAVVQPQNITDSNTASQSQGTTKSSTQTASQSQPELTPHIAENNSDQNSNNHSINPDIAAVAAIPPGIFAIGAVAALVRNKMKGKVSDSGYGLGGRSRH